MQWFELAVFLIFKSLEKTQKWKICCYHSCCLSDQGQRLLLQWWDKTPLN